MSQLEELATRHIGMNMGLDQDANRKKGAETKKSSAKKARDAKRGVSTKKSKKPSKFIRPE
ncbi:MAG: hypothetical protein ACKOB7_01780, partial [Methylocystis sp.]